MIWKSKRLVTKTPFILRSFSGDEGYGAVYNVHPKSFHLPSAPPDSGEKKEFCMDFIPCCGTKSTQSLVSTASQWVGRKLKNTVILNQH